MVAACKTDGKIFVIVYTLFLFIQNMDVSIIIVNYNTSHLVLDCVKSIKEKTESVSYEIIVVDNNSPHDEGLSLLSENEDIIFVKADENLGFGRANNLGVMKAHGEFLFFLNPDTLLMNNAIFKMVQFLRKESNVGACGGNLYDVDGKPTHSFSKLFPSITKELDFAFNRSISKILFGKSYEFNYSLSPMKVAFVTGADLIVPQKVWKEVGPFSDDFFMYYEETELEFRIKKTGYHIYSVPEARIVHLEGKSFDLNVEREKRILRGRFVYFYKVYGPVYNAVANALNIIMYSFGWRLCFLLRKLEKSEKYRVRKDLYIREMKRW